MNPQAKVFERDEEMLTPASKINNLLTCHSFLINFGVTGNAYDFLSLERLNSFFQNNDGWTFGHETFFDLAIQKPGHAADEYLFLSWLMSSAIRFGIDGLLQFPVYNKYRIGLVTNDAATTSRGALSRLALVEKGFRIVKLFSAEHGLSASAADGVSQPDGTDVITGLPAISLYGDHLAPTEEDLADIDLVVYDLPDIGCRFYTYQWTLSYIMESCSNFNKPLLILDRPNPLSGNLLLSEGPMLDEANCSSFIGRWTMPLRHSCTIGELASYWNDLKKLNVDLQIVKMEHWDRKNFFSDLGIAFVPTSPALPYFTIAVLYPGTGLLEGVNISEGRGTPYPFKICGAPFINSGQLTQAFNALAIPGIKASSYNFVPASGKYERQNCQGMMLHITDQLVLRPVTIGLTIINLLINLYPAKISEHAYKTAANPTGEKHLEKLTGMSGIWSVLHQEVVTFQMNQNGFVIKLVFMIMILVVGACAHNPYSKTNRQYKKQTKVLSKTIRQYPLSTIESDSVNQPPYFVGTTNFNLRKPNFVIIHHTAQNSCEETLHTFTTIKSQVSAHYVICKDGTIHHMLNDYLRAWQAGISKWGNLTDVNSSSIGIELDNNGFEPFTEPQINSLLVLLDRLKKNYSIPTSNFIGHADIAPGRKVDPNVFFPWEQLATQGFGLWYDDTTNVNLPINFNHLEALRIIGYNMKDTTAAIQSYKLHFAKDTLSRVLNATDDKILYDLSRKFQ